MTTVIYLPDFYQNTVGVQIQAGTYDIDDEDLRGLGEYLLETGHASEVKSPKEIKEGAVIKGKATKAATLSTDDDDDDGDETPPFPPVPPKALPKPGTPPKA